MDEGTIEKMFNYYFGKQKFEEEVAVAFREFLMRNNSCQEIQQGNDRKLDRWVGSKI